MRDLNGDDSAVSVSVGFILTFSITVLVLVITLTSFYSIMGQAEQTIMRDEFEIHGNDIALRIATMDTAVSLADNAGSGIEELTYILSLPQTIAGKEYSIEILNLPNEIVLISEERKGTEVKIPYSAENTNVTPTVIYSSQGEFIMVYSPLKNTITLK